MVDFFNTTSTEISFGDIESLNVEHNKVTNIEYVGIPNPGDEYIFSLCVWLEQSNNKGITYS